MTKSMIDFSLKDHKMELLKISKYMDVVQEYKDELLSISNRWDNLVLLSHLDNNNTNINETKNNFSKLTTNLLYHLSNEIYEKTIREMTFKAQISIDILIRNLFERTADIGFLSTDENIRYFIKENKNKYTKVFSENVESIKQRFKEYIQKYSVYYDIILTDTNGNILATLDETNKVSTSKDSIINLTINTNDDYIESFKYHDFLPNREKSLVYGYKVKEDNSKYSQTIGALFLCFGFRNEMKSVFDNLVNPKNKECLTILDKNAVVIASSDINHIRLGTKLEFSFDEKKNIVSFGGRDYLSKTCKTKGYQGYMGQEWYGHIMIPIEYAFIKEENELDIDKNILLSILQYGHGFSSDMKKIPIIANEIQTNLNRLVWNGNINKNNSNIT